MIAFAEGAAHYKRFDGPSPWRSLFRTVLLVGATILCLDSSDALTAEDMWGPGNDFSNAQQGLGHKLIPRTHRVPSTVAWRELCQTHFHERDARDRAKREEIERRYPDDESRKAQWAKHIRERDDTSKGCALTWPNEFRLPGGS